MPDDPQVLSKRLSAFVRSKMSAKQLSEAVGCDIRTAENIRRGHWPIARHWTGIVAAFGRDVTEAVFHPEAASARLEQEVRTLEAKLATARADLRVVAGDVPSRAQARPAVQDRTAQ